MSNIFDYIQFIEYTPKFESFLYNTWLKSYRSTQKYTTDTIYYLYQKKIIKNIIGNPDVKIKVVCNKDNLNHAIGYIVWEMPGVLHYVYIKHAYRNQGICSAFLKSLPIDSEQLTLTTHVSVQKWQQFSKKFNLIYNPYLLAGFVHD